jgi:drug/metabolite transporter (DMT)-like permease
VSARTAVAGSIAGVLLAAAGAASYAVTVVIGRSLASEGVSSAPALAIRFAIAAGVLAVVLAMRRTVLAPPPKIALKILALGAIGYAGQSTLFYLSLQRGTAASCILLFYAYPALVVLIAWAIGQGAPAPGTVAAVVLSGAGAALVAFSSGPLAISEAGIALALGSACVFALYVLAGSALGSGCGAMTIAAWVAAGAALASAGRGGLEHSLVAPSGQWPLLIAYGVMTAAAFSLMFAAIARLGAGRASVVMTLEAFFTVVLAALLLGEAITLGQAIGGVGILAGTVIISRARAGNRPSGCSFPRRFVRQVAFAMERRGGAHDDQAVRAL